MFFCSFGLVFLYGMCIEGEEGEGGSLFGDLFLLIFSGALAPAKFHLYPANKFSNIYVHMQHTGAGKIECFNIVATN